MVEDVERTLAGTHGDLEPGARARVPQGHADGVGRGIPQQADVQLVVAAMGEFAEFGHDCHPEFHASGVRPRGAGHPLGEGQPYTGTLLAVERGFADLGFARVDTDRERRQGAPEAIFGEGKTPDEVRGIARALLDGGASSVLVTRADAAARAALRAG